jgi:hypothetical protein
MNRTSESSVRPLGRLLKAASMLALVALAVAPLAASADQPILSIGTSSIGGTANPVPASGSVSSTGQADLCLAGQGATLDPTASTPTDAVQTGSTGCSGSATGATPPSSSTSSGGGGSASTSRTQLASAQTAAVIEATDASQLTIAAVRFTTKRVRSAKKLGLLVTLRGQQNSLVHHGIVAINNLPTAKISCLCQRATFSNQLGQAAFAIPVSKSMRAKRLFFRITAITPTIRATRLVSVRLP